MFTLFYKSVEIQQNVTKQTTNIEKNMSSWHGISNKYVIFSPKTIVKLLFFYLPMSKK
ncbi:hypothetical protein ABH942_002326 [Flavobacterium sp. 28YEA47A]